MSTNDIRHKNNNTRKTTFNVRNALRASRANPRPTVTLQPTESRESSAPLSHTSTEVGTVPRRKIGTVPQVPISLRSGLSHFSHPSSSIFDRLIELVLMALLAFTPLALGAVHPWSIAVFEVTAAAMAVLWIAKMVSSGTFKVNFSPVFLLFLILIAIASLQLFAARHMAYNIRYTTIYAWATKTELLKLIAYALVFLVTLNTIRTKAQIKRIAVFAVIVGFVMSLLYFMRYFGMPMKLGFVNSDHFSAYLGMLIPIALGLLLVGDATVIPLTFFTVIVMGGALFFTLSRGGMFSFIAALLFVAVLASTRRTLENKKWLLGAVALFIIFIIAWLGATPIIERLLSVKAEITSRYFAGRLPIWQGTIGIIKDNFIFGTGLGTFNYIFPKYQPLSMSMKHCTYAHSDILELFSEAGIVGFAAFFLLALGSLVFLFKRFYERRDPWVIGMSICIFGSLGAIFMHSFVDFNLHIPANAILLSVVLALFVSILNINKSEAPTSSLRGGRQRRPAEAIPSLIVISLLIIYAIAAVRPDPLNADYHYRLGKPTLSIGELTKAVSLNSTNSDYRIALALAYGRIGNVALAYQEFDKAIALCPNYYYPYYSYAYWLVGDAIEDNLDRVAPVLKKAIALNPKLENEAIALYFTVEKRYAKLKTILPDTPDNHYKVMSKLIAAGLWQENESDFKADMDKASYKYAYYKAMSDYYAKNKDPEKSLQILMDYLKIDPNCADAHFYIADKMAYMKPVKWDEIFAHYDNALAIDPDNMLYREWHARHLYYAKRYNEAISELEIVVKKDQGNVELQRLLRDWKKVGK